MKRFKEIVASTAVWGAAGAWTTAVLTSATVIYRFVPADRIDWLGRLYSRVTIALTGSRWRAEVHPAVDPNTPYMFVQNHTNHFDHVLMYNATPHFKQGLELEKHFRYPIYGWYMKSRGTIPVRPGDRAHLERLRERVRAEVEQGHSILAFPEGTRTLDGGLGRFRKGVFVLAWELGLPIVSVTVTGSFELMRKGSWLIHPGQTLTVHVDKPVPTKGLPREQLPELMNRVRQTMAERLNAYQQSRSCEAVVVSAS